MSARTALATSLVLGAAQSLACGEPPDAPEALGVELRGRVELHLAANREALRSDPTHAGLVFEVGQADLLAALSHVGVHRDGDDAFVLGSASQPELHGGGLLELILRHWRPNGRPAGLDDVFPFARFGPRPPLEAIAAGHRRQIRLPEEQAVYPRMHFGFAGRIVETDAYAFLRFLLSSEQNIDTAWTNREGQTLTTRRVLERVWDVYERRGTDPADADSVDHTALHAVEILVGFAPQSRGLVTREALGALVVERLRADAGSDETELLAHQVEALGLLGEGDPPPWTAEQRESIRVSLDTIAAGPFADLDDVPLPHLCHLARGLRLLSLHSSR